MSDDTKPAEHLVPIQLPGRYWTMIDFGLMTLEQAQAAWAEEQAAGVTE